MQEGQTSRFRAECRAETMRCPYVVHRLKSLCSATSIPPVGGDGERRRYGVGDVERDRRNRPWLVVAEARAADADLIMQASAAESRLSLDSSLALVGFAAFVVGNHRRGPAHCDAQ